MYALNGYISNNAIVVDENLSLYDGYNVVITILDEVRGENALRQDTNAIRKQAARELAGLWTSHEDAVSVDETVRIMRKGRSFDL